MDSEELKITQAACDIVNDAKYAGNVFVRGYYIVRAVEVRFLHMEHKSFDGWIKFVFPPMNLIPTCMIKTFIRQNLL
jgi:S-adenosylmethionine:tRNA ribosyltransferase-isomerase